MSEIRFKCPDCDKVIEVIVDENEGYVEVVNNDACHRYSCDCYNPKGVERIAKLDADIANAGAVPRRGSDVGTSPLLGLSGLED